MHRSGSLIVRRALFVDGAFCVVVGLLLAAAARWLDGELPVPEEWVITVAGLVTAVWGAALLVISQRYPTRRALFAVAIVNTVVVLAVLVWLVLDATSMSGTGLAVAGIIGISVFRFALYQAMVLRQ